MAHEVETMAWTNEVPWHGLGVEVEENLTPAEMQKAAGVDWAVRSIPSYVDFEGKKVYTGQKALVRETDGKVLTQVGENWNPVQNDEAFEFFADFVREGGMKMHTAGSLKGGEYVWALAKVEDSFTVFEGDKVESYLLFFNPHLYGKCVDVRFTPIRVVCNNTLSLSLGQKVSNSVRLNHRSEFNPDAVKEAMGMARQKMQTYKTVAELLGSKKATDEMLDEYFGKVFGMSKSEPEKLSRTAEKARRVMETQPGAEYAEGTMWQAFNAVTFMTDHLLGRTNDTRMTSAWLGANRKKKADAVELAVEMAEAA